MNFSYFINIMIIMLGISLIGTILQNKIKIWNNSQNMFFGCIGGLIAYFCGLSIVGSIVVMIACIIISLIIFKCWIDKDIFIIKSEKLKNFIIILAVSIIFIGAIGFTTSDLKIIFKDPTFIIYIFIIIIGISGIPKFLKFIQIYNPDEFEDGEIIYITDDFFDKTQNSMVMYNKKKFNFESMHFIINKKCTVENLAGENTITLNGISYSIKEKNNEILKPGDIVKISRENLDNGIIRKNSSIIVEKSI